MKTGNFLVNITLGKNISLPKEKWVKILSGQGCQCA
jgi:hypothetical protein